MVVNHELKDYVGDIYPDFDQSLIKIKSDLPDAEEAIIQIKGSYLEALEVRDEGGALSNDINFAGPGRLIGTVKKTTVSSSITVKNVTDYPTQIASSSIQSASGGFTYTQPNFELEAQKDTVLEVSFNPTEAKPYEGSFNLTSNYGQDIKIDLYGKGVDSGIEANFDGNSGDFGKVCSSTTKTLRIGNASFQQITITDISSDNDAFTIDTSNTTLTIDPLPGNTQVTTAQVSFNPKTPAAQNGIITITTDIGDPITIEVSGEGITSASLLALQIEGGNYDFGQVEIGQSTSKVLTLTNNSCDPINISDIGVSGAFSVASQERSFTLNPEESRNINITFAPTVAGIVNQEIPIVNDAVDNLVISLSGEGIENNAIDLSGEWIPTWQVDQCDILGSYCCGCSFHQTTRNFIFEGEYQCSSTQICGQLDWQTQQIGSSDTPITNNWILTGDILSIELQSGQSSGYQFTDRTLIWEGIYDPETDSFTGGYIANFYGGLIISAEARGTLTLKRLE